MSADNWAVCPRCEKKRAANLAAMQDKVDASYGKVPFDEFDAMRRDLAEKSAKVPTLTFREDYELGVADSEFYVIYKGGCRECGLKHEFRHEERIA